MLEAVSFKSNKFSTESHFSVDAVYDSVEKKQEIWFTNYNSWTKEKIKTTVDYKHKQRLNFRSIYYFLNELYF